MNPLDQNGRTEKEFLAQYDPGDYPRPSIASDIVIFTVTSAAEDNYRKLPEKELRVLLIKRGGHPFLGKWALPGGFVRPTESVGEAALRELREETGVRSAYLEQLYTFSEPGRDPRTWVVSCAHMALLDSSGLEVRAEDDAGEVDWFRLRCTPLPEDDAPEMLPAARRCRLELSNGADALFAVVEEASVHGAEYKILDNGGLAFDHAKIIACGLKRLRDKVEFTDLALNLMPEKFTLTQLQQVYEVILQRPLLKAAFRRKIAHLVSGTEEYTENAGHRPSRLFRRRPRGSG